MKIIRTTSGNVIVKNAAGKTIYKINPQADLEVKNDNEVLVKNAQGQYYTFFADRVTHTQIQPAAEIAFSGDAYALIDLLQASFFFKLSGGGGNRGITYRANAWHNFLQSPDASSSSNFPFGLGILVAFPILIEEEVTITDLKINITGAVAGNSVYGLYSSLNALPDSLIFASTPFNNGVGGIAQYTLPSQQTLQPGLYFVAYNTSSIYSVRAISTSAIINILGDNNSNISPSVLLSVPKVYDGTLPATFGAPTLFYSSSVSVFIPYVLFKII